MVNLRRLLICIFVLLVESHGFAASKLDMALDAWIKSNKKAVLKQRVLVSATISEGAFPDIKALQKNEYFRMLGLKQPPIANTRLFYVVNDLRPKSVQEAAAILRMDMAVELGPKNITVSDIASKKSIVITNAADDPNLTGRLRKAFGYDGYVVDVKKNLILARVTGNLLKVGSQAIIVGSSDPFLSAGSKIDASSLIEMISRRGDFGLFRVIIGKTGDEILPGSRVQFSTQ